MSFSRISILGVGLIGGSVGLACREIFKDSKIVGYSHRENELRLAVERGAIHEGFTDSVVAVSKANLVILCTPVGVFNSLMATIAPALLQGAIVTDVGSTKRSIVKLADGSFKPGVHFVGSHPMVGGDKHGIEHARADLLTGGLCIVTPTESTDVQALKQVEQFWQQLNMRTSRLSPDEHDRVMADVSHLPHLIAAALVRMQSTESMKFSGRGFADTTRIAAGDAGLWRDILLENRDNLKANIQRVQQDLNLLMQHLETGNAQSVEEWLAKAAAVRTAFKNNELRNLE